VEQSAGLAKNKVPAFEKNDALFEKIDARFEKIDARFFARVVAAVRNVPSGRR
jgi:hypothetical protein